MTLPVSSYEELLVRVRSLTHETIQLQRALQVDNDRDHNHNGPVPASEVTPPPLPPRTFRNGDSIGSQTDTTPGSWSAPDTPTSISSPT